MNIVRLPGAKEVLMQNRLLVLAIFLIFPFLLISEENPVREYNERAMETWSDDPSASIYYADKSIDMNNFKNREEFVNSHYIKALAYSSVNNYRKAINSLNTAYKFIQEKKYFYTNSQFYSFLIEVQFIQGQYSEMAELLSNKNVIESLNEKALLTFNLYKLKRDIIFNRDNITELIESNITAAEKLEYKDVLGDLYILYGDYLFELDLKKARDLYQLALDLGNDKISTLALYKLGLVYREWNTFKRSNKFLERAYLLSETAGDYQLTSSIFKTLAEGYRTVGDYKSLSLTRERENHFQKKHYAYLLKEQTDLLDTNYLNQKLSDEGIKSESRISIMNLIILSLAIITISLIIFISILSYRLRVYKLGEH